VLPFPLEPPFKKHWLRIRACRVQQELSIHTYKTYQFIPWTVCCQMFVSNVSLPTVQWFQPTLPGERFTTCSNGDPLW